MGIHFLSDILSGAAIGALMVLASQRLPIPPVAFKISELQRKRPVAFCVAIFVATYLLATFAADLRTLAGATRAVKSIQSADRLPGQPTQYVQQDRY